MKSWFTYIILLQLFSITARSQSTGKWQLLSPDSSLRFSFTLTPAGMSYDISSDSQILIKNASLALEFRETGRFQENLVAKKPEYRSGTESYTLIIGKTKKVQEQFNELRIPLLETQVPNREIDLLVRAFDDGIAFRYEFPQQGHWNAFSLSTKNLTSLPSETPLYSR